MSDLPRQVEISEEGPREGFQIEPGPIATERKIELVGALAESGLRTIEVASFVNPKRVPGWADADAVVDGIQPKAGVHFTALWLNAKGLERALSHKNRLALAGRIMMCASEPFLVRNNNRDFAANREEQRAMLRIYQASRMPIEGIMVMAAFGCNFAGAITPAQVVAQISDGLTLAVEEGVTIDQVSLADTMAWATPESIKRVVGAVRERWPALKPSLHLHDTRGLGVANAYAGLEMGVAHFDSSVAGLGGCPFAGHKGAAGNVCTEDLAFMCEEMGVATGIDLERLIATAQLAERIVGHPLPGSVMRGGTLAKYRKPH